MLGSASRSGTVILPVGPVVSQRLTVQAQELVSVVLATKRARQAADGSTLGSYRVELAEELSRFGMQAEWLGDGSLVATLLRAGNATDQVTQAARAALELHERWPEAAVALSTGRGRVSAAQAARAPRPSPRSGCTEARRRVSR